MSHLKKILCLMVAAVAILLNSNVVKADELSNVIKNITVTKQIENGEEAFNHFEKVYVNVDWSLGNYNANAGDTFSFSVAEQIDFPSHTSFELTNDSGDVLGDVEYDANTRIVTATFNDNIVGLMNVQGTITLDTEIKTGITTTQQVIDLEFEYDKQVKVISILLNPRVKIDENEKIEKWGNLNPDKSEAQFAIRLNYQKANIRDAVVSDHIGTGHKIDIDSFYIAKVYLDEYGNHIKLGVKVDPSEYNVIIIDDYNFKIEMGDISDTYMIYYKTTIVDKDFQSYENTVTLSGQNIEDVVKKGYASTKDGSGYVTGDLGKLRVVKVDKNDESIQLPNAEFALYNSEGEIINQFTTDSDGSMDIENLKCGQYTLKETKAPQGYRLETEEVTVEISNTDLITYFFADEKISTAQDEVDEDVTNDNDPATTPTPSTPVVADVPKTGMEVNSIIMLLVLASVLTVFYKKITLLNYKKE